MSNYDHFRYRGGAEGGQLTPKSSGGESSDALTDEQLRAAPVIVGDATGPLTVDGTVAVTDGGGSITVDGTVGVSGTVQVSGALTDAELAARLPLSVKEPSVSTTGSLSGMGQTVALTLNGNESAIIVASGTHTGSSITIEESFDGGTSWSGVGVQRLTTGGSVSYVAASVSTSPTSGSVIVHFVNTSGATHVRARMGSYGTGTINITIVARHTEPRSMIENVSGYGESSVTISQNGNVVPVNLPSSDSTGNNYSIWTINYPLGFNGSGWDRIRNNHDSSLLSSTPRTATTNAADTTLYNGAGVILTLNVTANPGNAETLGVKIQGKDTNNNYYDLVDFGTLLTAANGFRTLIAYPGAAQADLASNVLAKNVRLPRVWRAVVVHSGAGSWSYTLASSQVL